MERGGWVRGDDAGGRQAGLEEGGEWGRTRVSRRREMRRREGGGGGGGHDRPLPRGRVGWERRGSGLGDDCVLHDYGHGAVE